jgi:hypothetical protein
MSSIRYCFLFCFIISIYLNNYHTIFSHIPENIDIQEIIDQNDKINVQFGYDPEKLNINTLTNLKFSILNTTTQEHIKNFLARIVVTDGVEVFNYNNISVKDGDFSINHTFANYGNHQVLLRADTNSSISLASFNVTIPPSFSSSSSSQLSSSSSYLKDSVNSTSILENEKNMQSFIIYLIIGAGLAVSLGIAIILLSALKKNNK